MSYVVLARKWRPMTFEDLVGQEHVATTLANAIAINRVAHAFLFTGVRGVGKTTSARILAKALNCVNGPTAKPCLVCPQCTEITAGLDLDVQEIDAASRTGVDDIRELQERLVYRPQRDRFRIYIVDEVHMLSGSAWNAFLKTLEEPPPHVKFIFATTEVNKVPITILSRCQRYDFKLIAASQVASRLRFVLEQEGIQAEEGAVQILARESGGSMRDAMSLLDQVIAWSGEEGKLTSQGVSKALGVADGSSLNRIAHAVMKGDAAAALTTVAELADSGFDIGHLAKDFLGVLRDLVVAKVAPEARSLIAVPDAEMKELTDIAALGSTDDLTRLHLAFSRSCEDILESPAPRASFEMAVVRLARRPQLVPVDELVRRLADMEARLANAAPREAAPQGGRPAAQAARPRPRPSEPRSPGQQGAGDHGDDPEPAAGPPLSVTPPSLRPAASGWEAPVRAPGVGGQAAASPEHEPGFSSPQREPGGPISSPRQEPGGGRPVTSPQRESPPGGTSGTSPQRESRPPPASVPPPSAPPPSGPPASQPPAARGVRPGAMRPSVFTSGHSAIRDVADDRFGLLAAFVEAVRPRSARLASLIERAALVDAGPSRIAIGFDSRSFEAGLLSDPETHALLASVTEQHLGPSAELELCDIASDATIPTLAKLVTEAGQARRDEVDAELRGHPLVQAALTHLGAELRTVRLPKDVDAAPISLDDARARRLAQRG